MTTPSSAEDAGPWRARLEQILVNTDDSVDIGSILLHLTLLRASRQDTVDHALGLASQKSNASNKLSLIFEQTSNLIQRLKVDYYYVIPLFSFGENYPPKTLKICDSAGSIQEYTRLFKSNVLEHLGNLNRSEAVIAGIKGEAARILGARAAAAFGTPADTTIPVLSSGVQLDNHNYNQRRYASIVDLEAYLRKDQRFFPNPILEKHVKEQVQTAAAELGGHATGHLAGGSADWLPPALKAPVQVVQTGTLDDPLDEVWRDDAVTKDFLDDAVTKDFLDTIFR